MQLTPRRAAAEATLLRRHLQERWDLGLSGNYEQLSCIAKLDRLILTAVALVITELCKIPGYRAVRTKRVWGQLYREVTRIYGTSSIRQVIVESAPNVGWLARFRITVIPRDGSGLLLQDLCLILELIPDVKIVLVEIAFDFPLRSVVDTSFVQEHMLCGKTWMRAGGTALHERWGSSRSAKVARAYAKFEVPSFRLEFQLNARFLRKHQINNAFDFPKLATILPRHHIYFATLDDRKLREQLQRSGLPHKTKTEILKTVAESRKACGPRCVFCAANGVS